MSEIVKKMRFKFLAGVYFLVLATIVFLVDWKQTQPLFRFIYNVPFGDKIGHFCLMGVFSLLVNLALNAKTFKIWRFDLQVGSALVLMIVTIEEFSQLFVRGRTFDAGDLLADLIGIIVFGELARRLVKRQPNHES